MTRNVETPRARGSGGAAPVPAGTEIASEARTRTDDGHRRLIEWLDSSMRWTRDGRARGPIRTGVIHDG